MKIYLAVGRAAFSLLFFSQTTWAQGELAFCDSNALASQKNIYQRLHKFSNPNFNKLLESANSLLLAPPLNVVSKSMSPPSGDKHDYMSIALYAWPNPQTPTGKPWKIVDGKENKKRLKLGPDSDYAWQTSKRIQILSMAYSVTGDEKFAAKASQLLHAWFLDSKTQMNPNLNYAQAIPGKTDGTSYGIIEGVPLVEVLDSVRMLKDSPSWKSSDTQNTKAWMTKYRDWLVTSQLGKQESQQPNNHGTWYDAQLATIEYFLGHIEEVRKIVERQKQRIDAQIRSDGSQPLELKRNRPLNYSYYNLEALTRIAALGNKVGLNLWDYESMSGGSLKKAIDYLQPCLAKVDACPFGHEAILGRSSNKSSEGDAFDLQTALSPIRRSNIGISNHPYNRQSVDIGNEVITQNPRPTTICLPSGAPSQTAVPAADNKTVR